jgi:UDP-N-acetylmuramoylalanine--D-glutamate ligase
VINLQNKIVGVFGLGKAGCAAVDFVTANGGMVYCWDDNVEGNGQKAIGNSISDKWEEISEKTLNPKSLNLKPINDWSWDRLDFLLLSPGVPLTNPAPHPVVELAHQNNVQIIGEVELLWLCRPSSNYIGITGTNGKSTTTALLDHLLKGSFDIATGGNLGVPALALGEHENYLLEMSSYQLDLLDKAKFNIAVLLNITPDHLDRHGGMDGYIAAKKRIFNNQSNNDVAIINIDNLDCYKIMEELSKNDNRSKIITISTKQDADISVIDGILYYSDKSYDISDIQTLRGAHNHQNAAAAFAVAQSMGMTADDIITKMKNFGGLKHRQQFLAEINGIKFINDSKATNAESSLPALLTYKNIYWIAGGLAKEGGIESLKNNLGNVSHAFLIGQAEDEFADSLQDIVSYTRSGNLSQAFNDALKTAVEKNEKTVILLSPAAASMDQWKNFEERGEAFIKLVENFRLEYEEK